MEKIIGIAEFGEKVDVTDPCYGRDVWCRMNDVQIKPGEYECFADILSDDQTGGWGEMVARIGIRLVGSGAQVFDHLGEIGVDAGLAGFYRAKPDFTNDEWIEFCAIAHECPTIHLHDGEFGGRLNGFTASSGYGDGSYPVYAARNKGGDIVALEIHFIMQDDDGEEDEAEDGKC